jgi:hypothetical protein
MQGFTDRLKNSVEEEDIDFAEFLSKDDESQVADN